MRINMLEALSDNITVDPQKCTTCGTCVERCIMDNLRLYVNEINPRRPSARATGTIGGNIRAGFSDAGDDLVDAMRHGFTGLYEKNLHTGRVEYHPSPFTAVPMAMASIVRWQPLGAVRTSFAATEPAVRMLDAIQILFAGAESAVRMGADLALKARGASDALSYASCSMAPFSSMRRRTRFRLERATSGFLKGE